jgi:DNA-binding IclR family transcriptional regulator
MNAETQQNSVIHRLLDILLLFVDGAEQLPIDAIGQALDLPKSTTYRLVRELQERGFLERSGGAHVELGVNFHKLVRTAKNSNRDVRLMALPSMKRIAEAVRESVSLMRLMNRQVVCIESIEGQYALRVSIEQGRTQPIYAGASSRVLLAFQPEKDWPVLLSKPLDRLTVTTIIDADVLRENLLAVRRDGYAVSNGEIDDGARAVAVPLFNHRDEIVAALSIEAPASRMPDEVVARYIELLKAEAARVRVGQN